MHGAVKKSAHTSLKASQGLGDKDAPAKQGGKSCPAERVLSQSWRHSGWCSERQAHGAGQDQLNFETCLVLTTVRVLRASCKLYSISSLQARTPESRNRTASTLLQVASCATEQHVRCCAAAGQMVRCIAVSASVRPVSDRQCGVPVPMNASYTQPFPGDTATDEARCVACCQ